MNIFDLTLLLNGFPIGKAKTMLQDIQSISDAAYPDYIEKRKKEIVSYHLKHNSFYKNLVGNTDVDDWNSLPVMTKKDLQQSLENRLSKGYHTKNVYVNKTSGSSGDPFIFAKDKLSHALTWAVIQDRFSWYGLNFNSSLQARFYGIPLDKNGYYKERFKDFFSKRIRFSIFDLSDNTFKEVVQSFKKYPFKYINGYTSAIVQFAKYLNRENIILSNICPTLTSCVVTSEMLFDTDKKLMNAQFGVPIINEYGASELDLIAFQNPKEEWQINSETLYVEILDNADNVLPHGKEGRVVITSLFNKAHPFIRYDIGDIGMLSKNSTLKHPILENLIGRTNDIVVLPSGKKAAGLTFYYITKSIIENDGNVKEFVIEQMSINEFKVLYVSSEMLMDEKLAEIKKEMESYLEKGLSINFERVEKLKRSKSGKLKQFTSFINSY